MGNENGTWIMYGVDWNDPECLHTVRDAINYINETGFLPLFKNDIPGFSLEERTVPDYWWCGDPEVDPWEWRADGPDWHAGLQQSLQQNLIGNTGIEIVDEK